MKTRKMWICAVAFAGFSFLTTTANSNCSLEASANNSIEKNCQSRVSLNFNCSPDCTVEALLIGDDFVEVKVLRSGFDNVEFSATVTSSEEGNRYVSSDERHVFINKKESCIVFEDDKVIASECILNDF